MEKHTMIPHVLHEVAKYLQQIELDLPRSGQDARLDSAMAGSKIISWLSAAKKWSVNDPNIQGGNNRAWYDVSINGFYCKIKVTECTGNDNTGAKKAIYYLLTGEDGDMAPNQEKPFSLQMKNKESYNAERDFYYIIVNKSNEKDVFIVSLKGMICRPSPNNLPFQANWNECRSPVPRSWEEAKNYLLGQWAESRRKLIELKRDGMSSGYPEFFDC